uniref:SPARCL1 n=1 Tax=Amia calva TaxID=7924 RepID=A0A2U9EWI2_AMICA|nr:SPARCL1 [Amia calva]
MKTHVLLFCVLASGFAVPVTSKPHGKHHVSLRPLPQQGKNTDSGEELPGFISLEANSWELEEKDVTDDNEEELAKEKEMYRSELPASDENNSPVLLKEEALTEPRGSTQQQQEESQELSEAQVEDGDQDKGTESSSLGSDGSGEFGVTGEMDIMETKNSEEERVHPVDAGEQASDEIQQRVDYDPEVNKEGESQDKMVDMLEEVISKNLEDSQEQDESVEQDQAKGTNSKRDSDDSKGEVKRIREQGTEGNAEEKESDTNNSASQATGKVRKQKKIQLGKKSIQQESQERPLGESRAPDTMGQDKELEAVDNTVHKTKKRKTGKRASLVGMNPVQIRTTEELYPSESLSKDVDSQQAAVSPCESFRCKSGKVCKVNEENVPECVCQDSSTCIHSKTELEHVCGTDNKTYDTACQMFATKCKLEGTKKGHRLHLDYTGPCKYIAPCQDTELVQFPLRMRDWLKNVLLQLYEHDVKSPGFLTPKQRIRAQKINESKRHLQAGDHPIELLVRDFEKNYNMYIYPVHWQFAQMDQHPADRFLSHSELAPLRAPLVPMEHCTSRFFQECDANKDKQVSFKEWCACFSIKAEDMDEKLLF